LSADSVRVPLAKESFAATVAAVPLMVVLLPGWVDGWPLSLRFASVRLASSPVQLDFKTDLEHTSNASEPGSRAKGCCLSGTERRMRTSTCG
jgi:hypothetical protein